MTKLATWVFAALSILFVVVGLASLGQERFGANIDEGFILSPSVQSFGIATVGEVLTLKFAAENRTLLDVQIIGCESFCLQAGCLMAEGLPVKIPPCISTIVDKSLFVMLLPFLEQRVLYDAINQDLTILGIENRTTHAVALEVLACPSDPGAVVRAGDAERMAVFGLAEPGEYLAMAFTSYSASAGAFDVSAFPRPPSCVVPGPLAGQADGAFCDFAPIRLASIRDGLSQTMFVSEKATDAFFSLARVDPMIPRRHGWYFTGNLGDTLLTAFYPPNMPFRVAAAAGSAHTRAASSFHPGGVHVLLGDGSVRFVKETVDSWPFDPITGRPAGATRTPGGWWENLPSPGIWQALATRSGGELIDPTAF